MSESRKCKCTAEEQTGTTEIECCNICGLPIKGERWSFDNKWQPMDTAPKEGMILLDIGKPCAVVGEWGEFEEEFVFAGIRFNHVDGKWIDPYFVTQTATEAKAWMPLPEVE